MLPLFHFFCLSHVSLSLPSLLQSLICPSLYSTLLSSFPVPFYPPSPPNTASASPPSLSQGAQADSNTFCGNVTHPKRETAGKMYNAALRTNVSGKWRAKGSSSSSSLDRKSLTARGKHSFTHTSLQEVCVYTLTVLFLYFFLALVSPVCFAFTAMTPEVSLHVVTWPRMCPSFALI